MNTKVKIMEEYDYDIGYSENKTVETTDKFVTLTHWHKIGKESKLDMIMFTPEEAKELAKALNNSVRKYKRAGGL